MASGAPSTKAKARKTMKPAMTVKAAMVLAVVMAMKRFFINSIIVMTKISANMHE